MKGLIKVYNLLTGEEKYYDGEIGPKKAVICAYAQERKDYSTWQYEERYAHLVEEGKYHYLLGDWTARKEGKC